MAISQFATVLQHQLFIQRDARDPLGVWVIRHAVTGDATGGSIKVEFQSNTPQRIYVVKALQVAGLTGITSSNTLKVRLLTNFPPANLLGGVEAFATLQMISTAFLVDSSLTEPIAGPDFKLIEPPMDEILLFGPSPAFAQTVVGLTEIEIDQNINNATYSFEGYGYFWDQGALRAPGGPRKPLT